MKKSELHKELVTMLLWKHKSCFGADKVELIVADILDLIADKLIGVDYEEK